MRLPTRFVLAALALPALVLLLAAWDRDRLAARAAADALDRAISAQAWIEERAREDLARRAELVADDPAFAGYVELAIGGALPGVPVDTASLVDLLGERASRLGFAVTAVVDPSGRVAGASHALLPGNARETGDVFARALQSDVTTTGLWMRGDVAYLVAIVPLAAVGVSDGYVLAAQPVGAQLAEGIRALSGADARVVAGASPMPRGAVARPLFGSNGTSLLIRAAPPPSSPAAWLPWMLALAAVLVTAVVGLRLLQRRVLAPAALIAERLGRAASGDLHLQVATRDAGALNPLATAFNGLMETLRTSR